MEVIETISNFLKKSFTFSKFMQHFNSYIIQSQNQTAQTQEFHQTPTQ